MASEPLAQRTPSTQRGVECTPHALLLAPLLGALYRAFSLRHPVHPSHPPPSATAPRPLDCVSNFSLNLPRCIPNAKGALCHRRRICNPFWDRPTCRWDYTLLTEGTRSREDIGAPILPLFRILSAILYGETSNPLYPYLGTLILWTASPVEIVCRPADGAFFRNSRRLEIGSSGAGSIGPSF